jgi:hypothetical protein
MGSSFNDGESYYEAERGEDHLSSDGRSALGARVSEQAGPGEPENYPPPEVVGLANITNPSEPLEHILFVSNS